MKNLLISMLVACLVSTAFAQPGKKDANFVPPPLLEPTKDKLPLPVKVGGPEKGTPKVGENKPAAKDEPKPYDIFMVAPPAAGAASPGEVGIGFFNHSKRDVVLEVKGKSFKLGAGYYVQIKMPREFTWREQGGKDFITTVPAEFDGAEIVFRR